MKKIILFYPLIIVMTIMSLMTKGKTNTLQPPKNLTYTRVWIDKVKIRWEQPNLPEVTKNSELDWHYQYSFKAKNIVTNQQAISSDGESIYTASFNTAGKFLRYTMEGDFIEEFFIPDIAGIRDLTFDGQYFYGGAEGIYKIYKLDLKNKKLSAVINATSPVRHITYIPTLDGGKGGFEIGDWNTSELIKKDGTKIETGFVVESCYGTSYDNGKFYAFQQTGLELGNGNGKQVIEFDMNTKQPTGKILDLSVHSAELGLERYHMAGGMDIVEYNNGRKLALLNCQSNGNVIVIYEVRKFPLPENLSGYNIYRDGTKINKTPLDKFAYEYTDHDLKENREYTYTLKTLYRSEESQFSSPLKVNIPNTSILPFYEDFETENLKTNYWSVTADTIPRIWTIERGNVNGDIEPHKILRYRSTLDSIYRQNLISKEFDATGANNVLIRYDLALNCFHNEYSDTLYIDLHDGTQWINIDEIPTVKGGIGLDTRIKDISSKAIGKKCKIKFRVHGNCKGKYLYDFFIDNIKIWAPVYTNLSATIKHKTDNISQAEVTLRKNNDVYKYESITDDEGKFTLNNIETGQYTISIKKDGYNHYLNSDLNVTENLAHLEISLTSPQVNTNIDNVNITLSPDKKYKQEIQISNTGDGDADWEVDLKFKTEIKEQKTSKQMWNVLNSFNQHSNSETAISFLNGYIYTFSANPQKRLVKYTKEGEILNYEIYLPPLSYYITSMTTDGEYLYFIGSQKIIKYDLANNIYLDTINVNVPSFQSATFDKETGGFYLADYHTMYKIDSEGTVIETYDITGAMARGLVLDNYSEAGPFIWIYCNTALPGYGTSSEKITIKQFSLKDKKFTDVSHSAIDVPGYITPIGRETTQPQGLCGTIDYRPGKFVLIGSIGYVRPSNQIPSLMFAYEMSPSVKWLNINNIKGNVKAGSSDTLTIDFNSIAAKTGDKFEVTLSVKSNPDVGTIEIPVVINVDIKADEKCYKPSGLLSNILEDNKIQLTWDLKSSDDSPVENLVGFNLFRNGEKINTGIIADKTYIDENPQLGDNNYTVTAIYDFNCESYNSESLNVQIKYLGECPNITNTKTSIINQRHIYVEWDEPKIEYDGYFEDFESYSPFIIDNIGDWKTVDMDGAVTYGFEQAQFPHAGEPMAFIVYNPQQTKPVSTVDTYKGKQVLACFNSRIEGIRNNDWLISKELNFDKDFTLNFYAKTHDLKYGFEKIKIGYSTTSDNIEDFIFLNDAQPYSVPEKWTEFKFAIPADAKYIAINCVSLNSFILLLDNIYIGAPETYFTVKGYNIYRDAIQLNETPIENKYFYDFALTDGQYNYQIESIYTNTCVSDKSDNLPVTIDYTNKCNPVKNLTYNLVEEQKVELTWSAPAWSDPSILKYHTGVNAGSLGWEEGGEIWAATKWSGKELALWQDYELTGLEIFVAERADITIFIMSEGKIIATQDVTGMININEFSIVTFDNPVSIDISKDYLIGFKAIHNAGAMPVGTDNGPSLNGRGDLVSIDGNTWFTLKELDPNLTYNWNISIVVEELGYISENTSEYKLETSQTDNLNRKLQYKNNTSKVLSHFNTAIDRAIDPIDGFYVYKNGTKLNQPPLKDFDYLDQSMISGIHQYMISTVYNKCGEVNSESLTVNVPVHVDNINSEIKIYSFEKQVFIKLNNKTDFTVEVFTISGTIVKKLSFENTNEVQIGLDNNPTGQYLIRLLTNDRIIQTKKIIIL